MNDPRSIPIIAISCVVLLFVGGCGGNSSEPPPPPPPPPVIPPPPSDGPPPPPPSEALTTEAQSCTDGLAGSFACDGISLLSRVPLEDMEGFVGNDIWGWHDAETEREYALMGLDTGTSFVDITVPNTPVILGRLPSQTDVSFWRDIKVYQDHAFVVADRAGAHGMQVFDLTRLRDVTAPQEFSPDIVYGDFEHSHNLAINEDTGFGFAVSTNTCEQGLHMIDLSTPVNPQFAGCHSPGSKTHDTQCVVYEGTDTEYVNREICFSSSEDFLEVVDVSDKSSPLSLSSTTYPNLGYVHQGWLTEDHQYFILGDELDETNFAVPTITHVFDVSDLNAPFYLYAYEHNTQATDHNLYVLGNRVFEANYSVGLRVLEFADEDALINGNLVHIASFDTYTKDDDVAFYGAWSVYPYLPSGTIIVSDTDNGLFILAFQ